MANYQKAFKSGYIDLGFGKIPVAVLKDGTRLITKSGFHKALGRAAPSGLKKNERPALMPSFLANSALKPFIDNDLEVALLEYHEFSMPSGGKAVGYRAELLPKVCEVFLKARDAGVLTGKNAKFAASADLIIRALANVGVIGLIDEATGYQEFRDKTALQSILDKYLDKEAAKWAKTFPDEFYLGVFRIKKWNPAKEIRHKPQVLAHITKDLVYKRLTPGLLETLEEINPTNEKGIRKERHHQFLTREQGLMHLKGHIFMIIKLMNASNSWEEFMEKVNNLLPYATMDSINLDVKSS